MARLLGLQFGGTTWLLWALSALAVAMTAIGVVSLAGLDESVWDGASVAVRWMVFATGIGQVIALPVFIAHGVTRAVYTVAGGLLTLLVALAVTLYLAAGYAVELAVRSVADLPAHHADSHLFSHPGQVHLMLAEFVPLLAAYSLSGWLVALAYYRFGGIGGTLCLPLTLLPMAGAEVALNTYHWQGGFPGWPGADSPALLSAAAALVVALAGFVAVRVFTPTVPVRSANS